MPVRRLTAPLTVVLGTNRLTVELVFVDRQFDKMDGQPAELRLRALFRQFQREG